MSVPRPGKQVTTDDTIPFHLSPAGVRVPPGLVSPGPAPGGRVGYRATYWVRRPWTS